jgi:phosphoglycolate phosphatase
MNNKVVIFDFDGTIADTFSIVVEIVNSLSEEYGFQKLGIEEVAALRQRRAQELLKVFSMPLWKIPSFLFRVKELLGKQIRTVEAFDGMLPALEQLKNRGYRLGILSSNNMETVDSFLEKNHITMFDFVYCEKDLFGKSRVLKNLLKQYSMDRNDVVYVGDETRDIEAAHGAKLRIVSVGWGYNTIRALETQKPDILIDRPSELVDSVNKLFVD